MDADSEIMAVAPFFPEYRPFVNANGGKLVVVPADTKAFQIHLDEVEKRHHEEHPGYYHQLPQ